jgi:UDP-3-O-[3-hydroxymyristoyl] glucosamine N-acyltransferase
MKLGKICELIKGDLKGEPHIEIKGISGIKEAKKGEITFLSDKRYVKELKHCKASAIIVNKDINIAIPSIIVENPYLAFAKLLEIFYPKKPCPKGIDKNAIIKKNVKMGKDITIFPYVYIGSDVELGDRVILYAGVFVGDNCRIGDDAVIYPNVSIYENVRIGKNVIIHSGTVIGSDGFGFVKLDDESYYKIPQVGSVCIEDDVEIGANVCIDRANLGETIVKKGTKIDNLIHLAHNVSIGKNTIIASQTGISGSCEIGDHVVLAGQVGVVDHVKIGDHSIVIAQSGITHDIPPKSIQSGSPSMDHSSWRKVHVLLPRLPEFVKSLKELGKKISKIEKDKK